MDLTISTTTESQAAIEHAASENWREPFVEPDAAGADQPAEGQDAEKEAAAAAGDESAAHDEAPPPESEPGKDPTTRNGWQKRVDKLTKKNYEMGERVAQLERELAARGAPERKEDAPAKPEAKGRPTADQFQTEDEYLDALTDWKIEQKLAAKADSERRDTELQRTRLVFDDYNRALSEARGRYADFDEVVGRTDIQIPNAAQVAIIESGVGPEIAYYLGKNPEKCKELCEMSPAAAAVAIGRIASRFDQAPPASPSRKPAPAAPVPIRPVAARTTASAVPLGEMSMADYRRARRAGAQ